MFGATGNRLFRDFPLLCAEFATCVRVHIKSWEVATGDIKANTMAFLEDIESWVELECELVGFAQIKQFLMIAGTNN